MNLLRYTISPRRMVFDGNGEQGGRALGELAALVEDGTVSVSGARQVLAEMVRNGGEPRALVASLGLQQVSDPGAMAPIVDR